MGTKTRRRVQTALVVAAIVLVALAGLGALALYLAPRVLPNLQTTLAPVATAQTVAGDGVSAEVTVPAGWSYHRGWGDDGELVLRTPDGVLSVSVRAGGLSVSDAFADEADAAALDAPADEVLASGLEARHADDPDGGVFVAAVGRSGAVGAAQLVARAPADRLGEYRAALAELLDSVRVTT